MSIVFRPQPHDVTWASFREIARSEGGLDAQTGYDISATFGFSRGSDGRAPAIINATVIVSLVPADTWVVRGRKTAALLDHERLHYIATTMIGRELDRELPLLTGAGTTALQQAAQDLIQRKNQRALDIGQAYDGDTDHGGNAAKQATWATRVRGWERDNNRVTWP